MSDINTSDSIGNMDLEAASQQVEQMILSEIEPYLSDIKKQNPNIDTDTLVERYINYLKALGDPRVEFFHDLHQQNIQPNEADQALDVVQTYTSVRDNIVHALQNGLNEEEASHLPVDTGHALRGSVLQFNTSDMIQQFSLQERKKLTFIINSLVIGNIGLMVGEITPGIQEHIDQFYEQLESLSDDMIRGDHMIGLMIVSVFGYEGWLKVREVGLKSYIKHHTGDFALNLLGVMELGTIAWDTITQQVHPGIASLVRSFRAIRLLKVMNDIPSVRKIFDAVSESVPNVLRVTGAYALFSLISMLMLIELTQGHIEEFATLGSALNEMRNLFYADGFQPVLESIETSETMGKVSQVVASTVANTYQLVSSTFYFAIPTAIFADAIQKGGQKLDQTMAMTLERVDQVIALLKDIKTSGINKKE